MNVYIVFKKTYETANIIIGVYRTERLAITVLNALEKAEDNETSDQAEYYVSTVWVTE